MQRGNDLLEQGDPRSAVEVFSRCVAVAPTWAEAYSNLGVAYKRSDEVEQALASFDRALALSPVLKECCYNAAGLHLRSGNLEAALEAYHQAAELEPTWPEAHLGIGIAQMRLGNARAGQEAFLRALSLRPGWAEAYQRQAHALEHLGRHEEALQACRLAVEAEPDCPQFHCGLAHMALKLGDFETGWAESEWRFKNQGRPARRSGRPQPLWQGEPLDGRTLLLCQEQGSGDMIQFVRLVSTVSSSGGRVLVECTNNLRRLFMSLPGLSGTVAIDQPFEEASFQLPLLSLPRILGIGLEYLPARVPYLFPAGETLPQLEHTLSSSSDHFKVGIVWTGNSGNSNNVARSCTPEDFAPLTEVSGVQLFSLQYEHSIASEHLNSLGFISLQPWLGDFARTAAVVVKMDLVITVDTSMAHLAGALGQPVWTLLHEPTADWRWFLERTDTPWYPTMRLFRQHEPGNWQGVFEDLKRELTHRVESGVQQALSDL